MSKCNLHDLAAIMDRFEGYVAARCRRLCALADLGTADIDDLIQETWIRVAQCGSDALPCGEHTDDDWKRLLNRIVRNLWQDLLKSTRRRRERHSHYQKENRPLGPIKICSRSLTTLSVLAQSIVLRQGVRSSGSDSQEHAGRISHASSTAVSLK